MIKHILTASPEDLQAEAERISLLDEPDREEAILELLQELQERAQNAVYKEEETLELLHELRDYAQNAAYEEDYDEDSWDPDTYEREDNSMELIDDPFSV